MKNSTSRPSRCPALGAALGLALLAAPGLSQAALVVDIDFSEVPLLSSDPLITP